MIDRFERFSFAISEIYRYWHKITSDEMEPFGLKGPAAVYFTTMYQYPEGLTSARLAELCGRDKADVSRTVSAMEKLGLVEREVVNQNLYRALLKLTDRGSAVAEQINEKAKAAVGYGGSGLTDEQREIFYYSLETIAANLQRLSKEGLQGR